MQLFNGQGKNVLFFKHHCQVFILTIGYENETHYYLYERQVYLSTNEPKTVCSIVCKINCVTSAARY